MGATQRKTILVVDPDPGVGEYCRKNLGAVGHNVCYASDALQGLACLEDGHIDLAVLDVMLEGGNSGLRLAEMISLVYPEVPLIVLCSIAEASQWVFEARLSPLTEFVPKPLATAEFMAAVRLLLRGPVTR